ncbi:MAG: antibiotic biosynthesis monooxygenase [bacterium]|nr:antibiotic biosynthesis monooxygenase [bacterium]
MSQNQTPYFVTIVTTEFSGKDPVGYDQYRAELSAVVSSQPGFMRSETVHNGEQTVSLTYWESEAAMQTWASSPAHQETKKKSHAGGWYKSLRLEIAQVTTAMEFPPRKG